MQLAICEDDSAMLSRLKQAIEAWSEKQKSEIVIFSYQSAEAFLFAWPETSFDLVFLDIQMNQMSGIELAKHIRKTDKNMLIVFITSFMQYAIDGYDVNALHYLVKPLSVSKLLPILDKALTIIRSRQDIYMTVPEGKGIIKIMFGEILYFSVQAHIASIYTSDAVFKKRNTMGELKEILPTYFVRCHRSYIVNLFKVECVYGEHLLLTNGEKLPISRKNSKEVKDAFIRMHTGTVKYEDGLDNY